MVMILQVVGCIYTSADMQVTWEGWQHICTMSGTEDYYQILGVDKTATPEDIKKAFV